MNKKILLEQIKKIHLNPSEEIISKIVKDAEKFEKAINDLKSIDTKDVKPLYRVDETLTTFLREDKAKNTLEKDSYLSQAPKTKAGYVLIDKVVGDE